MFSEMCFRQITSIKYFARLAAEMLKCAQLNDVPLSLCICDWIFLFLVHLFVSVPTSFWVKRETMQKSLGRKLNLKFNQWKNGTNHTT